MINQNELCSITRPVAAHDADKVRDIQAALAGYMDLRNVFYETEAELKVNLISRSSLQRAYAQGNLSHGNGRFRDTLYAEAPDTTLGELSVRMTGLRTLFDNNEQAYRIDVRLASDTLRAERAHYLARFVTGKAYEDQMRAIGTYRFSVLLGTTYTPKHIHNSRFRELLRPKLSLGSVRPGFTADELRKGAFVSTGTRVPSQEVVTVRTVRPMPAGLLNALRG